MLRFLFFLLLFSVAVVAWLVWGAWRRARYQRRLATATSQFVRNRPSLAEDFRAAANVTGKPRGLIWKSCDFHDGLVLARDRATGELVGLVGATIGFEAVAGGDMEEVEAVGNLRAATAVFTFSGREWTTHGRALFNLEPREVLDRYGDSLDAV